MIKGILLLLLTLMGILSVHAQSTSEELGERLFNLFKNESKDFSSTLPTMEQLSDQVKVITVVPFQSRLKSFSEEYPVSVKRFNEKCFGILEKGKEAGIKWKRIKLESVIPYPQNIDVKFADQMATVKFTKLCINFSFRRREFIFIADAVMDFNGQYLICDDLIEFSEIATNTWYRP
jgi:hypothetical protein